MQDVLEMILYVLFAYRPAFLKTGLPDMLKSMLGKGMQFSKPSLDKRPGFCYVKMNLLQLCVRPGNTFLELRKSSKIV